MRARSFIAGAVAFALAGLSSAWGGHGITARPRPRRPADRTARRRTGRGISTAAAKRASRKARNRFRQKQANRRSK